MTDWRALEILQCVAEVRKLIGRNSTRDVILSAALVADAALNYRSLEKYGQSYTELAAHLDWVVPMAYFREDRQPVDWIEKVVSATRFHFSDNRLFEQALAKGPLAWLLVGLDAQEDRRMRARRGTEV